MSSINRAEVPDILVLGIGNFLMGDEGIGVHFIKDFIETELPENVEVLDGGTGGFHLMSYLESYPVIIMVDATMNGQPAGTIDLIKPKFAKDFPTALSAHDIGLKDLIESLIILDKLPEIFLFTVSISEIQNMTTDLSDSVQKSIPTLKTKVLDLISKLNSA